VPIGIAQALVEGLEHDFVAHDAELQRLVPRARLGLEAAIRAAIDADRQHAVIARWVEGSIACRNFRPEYAFYAKREGATARGAIDAERVFATVCTIGGEDGWFYDVLWWLRGAIDRCCGPSWRTPAPTELRVGDVVDSGA
jgi:hypothetical protein